MFGGMTGEAGGLVVLDAVTVRAALSRREAAEAVRGAMIALSTGRVRQLLRSFIRLEPDRTFALMPAAFDGRGVFGAKLVSVFAGEEGHRAHQGVVVLFDGETGAPVCIADASEITAIRTAAASAVATDALARPDARVLTVLGLGAQAREHIPAIAEVRELAEVRVWGRSPARARAFAAEMGAAIAAPIRAVANVKQAVAGADIICTLTAAQEPILFGREVAPGTHVNVVGSSVPGPAEIDDELVVRSRFFVDHADHVRVHGAEFLHALMKGVIGPDHIAAEIGEVLAGAKCGRTSPDEITVYKSLGHAVQDLAAAAWLYDHAR